MACCLIVLAGWVFPALLPSDLPAGKLDRQTLKSQVPAVLWAKPSDRLELIRQPSRADFLRVTYPAGGWGSKNSGAQILFSLPPAKKATAEYRVRFAEGFDFVKGGKLPGLAGGAATTGNRRPTGDGWSARFMWRSGGDAVLYLYHLNQRKQHGDDLSLGVKFKPGVWHTIKQRITVNHNDQRDGRIEVWFDFVKVLDADSLALQQNDLAPVNRFYFSTFFGGSGDQWAPTQDQTIDFAAFRVD